MRVGFLNNQIDNRGTGNALFDYAHYNEEILGNESLILTLDTQQRDQQMENRLLKRFGMIYSRNYPHTPPNIDVVYHIKSGVDTGFRALNTRYAVHAVFDYQPHGDKYAVVSPWMGRIYNSPYVPHIVNLPETTVSLRDKLGIGKDDIVFGRYGGSDSFDIPFVWSAIGRALKANKNIWFLFMNTDKPTGFYDKRVIFRPPTADPYVKRKFINTCDAMIHARQRGETFGIAVGEFANAGKQILSYGLSGERNHLDEFPCFVYYDEEQLYSLLSDTGWEKEPISYNGYRYYTPEKVMAKFKEVFLD